MNAFNFNSGWQCSAALFFLLIILTFSPVSEGYCQNTGTLLSGLYRYQTLVGDETSFFIWELSRQSDVVQITVNDHENDRFMINRCKENGETDSWLIREKGTTEIRAEKNGNTMHIFGKKEGKYLDETYTIDSSPWYQPLSFSLTEFLFSEDESTIFWSIRQDSLELVRIVAKKIGLETISINNQQIPAFKIEIRLDGFLSAFWHGTYWYRQENGQFLKYSAVLGPPGSDRTVISFVDKIGG